MNLARRYLGNHDWPPPPYMTKTTEEEALQNECRLLLNVTHEARNYAEKGQWRECQIYLETASRALAQSLSTARQVLEAQGIKPLPPYQPPPPLPLP